MRPIHPLLHGAVLLCLALSLSSCATDQAVRTETITVEKPVIVAVPAALTRVPPEPTLPAGEITNDDLADLIERLRAWGRGMAGQLRKIGGLAPAERP